MSQATIIKDTAIGLVGSPYVLGNEAYYDVGYEPSSHPMATDCSGVIYTCYRKADVKWNHGQVWQRVTADSYWRMSERINRPERIGDCAYFLGRSGTAYHVAIYIGNGETVEARGRKWGVVRYKINDPVNGVDTRKCKWGRFPWVDLGEEEDDMTRDQEILLKQCRLSDVAQSYQFEIVKALMAGDAATADKLEREKDAAVKKEKARLKI